MLPSLLAQLEPPDPEDILNEELRITAEICLQQLDNIARADALPPDEFPSFEIVEEIDDATCELCQELDGQIIDRDHPDFEELQDPSHINCRRILSGIGADEIDPTSDPDDPQPIEPNYQRPTSDLINEHGHFMVDRERYAPLMIPSQPEGRDFISTNYRGDDGNLHSRLKWRVPPYEIPGYTPPP